MIDAFTPVAISLSALLVVSGAAKIRRPASAAGLLAAVGVLSSFGLVREEDAVGSAHDLDGEDDWWAALPTGAAVPEFLAVRDLELVDPGRWPDALTLLAQPPLRER